MLIYLVAANTLSLPMIWYLILFNLGMLLLSWMAGTPSEPINMGAVVMMSWSHASLRHDCMMREPPSIIRVWMSFALSALNTSPRGSRPCEIVC